jgi:hypothetical protein
VVPSSLSPGHRPQVIEPSGFYALCHGEVSRNADDNLWFADSFCHRAQPFIVSCRLQD